MTTSDARKRLAEARDDLTPLQQHAWDRSCVHCRHEVHAKCLGVVWVAADNDSVECACGCQRTSSPETAVRASNRPYGASEHHVSDLRAVGNDSDETTGVEL